MKKNLLLLAFSVFFATMTFASNTNPKPIKVSLLPCAKKSFDGLGNKAVLKLIKIDECCGYFWGFADGSACFQLYRIEQIGDSYIVTEMNAMNYAGTYQHCPPTGQMYC